MLFDRRSFNRRAVSRRAVSAAVRARWQLLATGGTLLVVLLALPGPLPAFRSLEAAATIGGTAVVDATAVVVASTAGWLVAGWGLVILATAALARVPGAAGRWGGAALRRVAPAAVRRVLVAGAGLTMLAGATACAGPPGATDGPTAAAGAPLSAASIAAEATGTIDDSNGIRWGATASAMSLRSASERESERTSGLEHGIGEPASSDPASSDRASGGDTAAPNLDWPVIGPTTPDLDWPESPPDHQEQQDRPTPKSAPRPGPTAEPVVVLAGDTLWSIAADRLGPGATDVEIDAAWRAWYATNRELIGADPDLILPGQRLSPPPESIVDAPASSPAPTHPTGTAGPQNGEDR